MTFPLVLILLISIIFAFANRLFYRLSYKLPPGPFPWPIIGNLHQIKPERSRFFADLSEFYGPIISLWFGSTLTVIVSSAELAEEVLKEKDQQLANRHRTMGAAKLTNHGKDLIWADYSPHYVKLRKVCTLELFSPRGTENLRHIREDEVKKLVESIFKDCTNPDNHGKSLVLRKYLRSVGFNNITRLVLGKRFEIEDGVMDEQGLQLKDIVAKEAVMGIRAFNIVEQIWWLRWISSLSSDKELLKHMQCKGNLVRAIMKEQKAKSRKNGRDSEQNLVKTFLGLQEKYELQEDTIIGLLWDMITAGMDTIAITVEWGMAELVKNWRVQQKAQEELDRVLGSDHVMTEADISKLPYLQCVAKEALRLHPPTPLMLPHKAGSAVKIGGYDIPKGTVVEVNVWAIARDARIWHDPLKFWPERFLQEDVDVKGHDFRLLPFGAGRRMCPAVRLGLNMVTLMLGRLLHHFSWRLPDGVKADDIDMLENPGLVTYMRTPIQAVPATRLPEHLYSKHQAVHVVTP